MCQCVKRNELLWFCSFSTLRTFWTFWAFTIIYDLSCLNCSVWFIQEEMTSGHLLKCDHLCSIRSCEGPFKRWKGDLVTPEFKCGVKETFFCTVVCEEGQCESVTLLWYMTNLLLLLLVGTIILVFCSVTTELYQIVRIFISSRICFLK
jgi:hypothetical protein